MTRAVATVGVALALIVSACSRQAGGPDAGPPPRRFLSIGTAPPGGAFFVVGGALAEVLNEHQPGGNWQVNPEATKGSQENIRRLHRGELDFALANAAITFFAVRGDAGWTEAQQVQVVMTLAPNVALFITPRDSGLRTMADLRGSRVVVGPAGAGFEFFLRPLLAAHGLSYDDFRPLHNTQSGAVDMLADGSADAAFLGGAVPTASITQASSSQDIHFVPFEEPALERLVNDYAFFDRATIPATTYRDQSQDFHGLNVGSMHLITAAAADADLVYQVTRTIYDNRAAVVERHAAGRAIRPEVVVRDTGTPFHPGAVRYYREIGIWPAAAAADATP